MSTEQIRALIIKLYAEAVDGDNIGLVDELCAADMVIHDPIMGQVQGAEAFKNLIGFFKGGFPGFQTEIHQVVVEGDTAAIYHTHHIRHTGEFMGVSPSGRTASISGLELARVRDGKITEWWRHDDDAGLMRFLGILQMAEA